jgi:putative ABC transport system permease protein
VGSGATEPVPVAYMTASGFRVARVAPLLGRTLSDGDEHAAAPAVVVIGHDLWRSRFAGDPAVVGRDVRLGGVVHTVVGVMPEGFAFPLAHSMWAPLRVDGAAHERRSGPSLHVFGRLAPGATLESARAELSALGARMAAEWPDTHQRLRPRVMPYAAQVFDDMQGWEIPFVHLILVLLLAVVSANVAVLVYARTVARTGEIAVRGALGASRSRIVGQLFVEALVLALAAAALGLAGGMLAIAHVNALLSAYGGPAGAGGIPYWWELRLRPATLGYVLGLTVLSAAVVGVLPAVKAAGGRVQGALRQLSGGTGMQLGRTWNALIVAQVAMTVAFLPPAVSAGWKSLLHATADPGFAADEFLAARVFLDSDAGAAGDRDRDVFRTRFAAIQSALGARLLAEPGIEAVTFAADLPGQEPLVRVVVEAPSAGAGTEGHAVRSAQVDPGFFDAFGVTLLSGRRLHDADAGEHATAVVVNRSLARQFGSGSVLGRRIRYAEGYRSGGAVRMPAGVAADRWYEVVGVVADFPAAIDPDDVTATAYHALAPGQAHPVSVSVRTAGAVPPALAARSRDIAAALDPAVQLRDVRTLDAVLRDMQGGMRMIAIALALLMTSVLLLSAAGIYALMSFTVARRRREIGIRAALGADPRRLLRSIFARALRQLSAGVLAGLALAGLLELATGGEALSGRGAVLLPAVALLMIVTGLIATFGPARRGLSIQPTEALRAE